MSKSNFCPNNTYVHFVQFCPNQKFLSKSNFCPNHTFVHFVQFCPIQIFVQIKLLSKSHFCPFCPIVPNVKIRLALIDENFQSCFPSKKACFERPVGDSRLKVKIKSRYDDDHHDPTQKEQNKDTFFREQEHQVKLFGIDIATLGAIHIQGYFACNNISQCLKITQNVAFEFWHFGIFHQFLTY